MKLTAMVKLQPSDSVRQLLFATLARANAACNTISQQAWECRSFGRSPVHRRTYSVVREDFVLAAQLAIRCIGKVVDAYKLDRKTQRRFRKLAAIPYDNRILNWRLEDSAVSICSKPEPTGSSIEHGRAGPSRAASRVT